METDIERWMSADSEEGRLTMPVRRVGAGTSTTTIRRLLLLIYTDRGDDIDTESDIKLQIFASGQLMLDKKITHDFDQVRAHWHFLEVERPFTRADVASKGSIQLSILGTDAWLPMTVFVFGLDTEEGRPNDVVTLSAIPKWDLGWLSTDTSDGEDVLDNDYGSNVGDGEAYLNGGNQLPAPFDSATLTNSSVRVGLRDDDAWAPGDVLVFGHSLAEFQT